jgi:hypothetical protein
MYDIGTGKEGTMCTAFSYCRFQKQRLRVLGVYAPIILGSFGSGPWALRPKRLQWLTNIRAGFKIAAFPVLMVFDARTPNSVTPAQAGAQLSSCSTTDKLDASLRWHDGVKCGEQSGSNMSRALPHFSFYLRILIGRRAMAETSPPFFHHAQAPP